MATWLQQVITPKTADKNLRRQGVLVIIVSLALTILALVLGVNSLLNNQRSLITIVTLFGTVIYIACAALARVGIVRFGAYVITWVPALGILANLMTSPSPVGVAFIGIPIMISSLVLSSIQILPVTFVSLGVALAAVNRGDVAGFSTYYSTFFYLVMISALAYLGAWSVERALRMAYDAQGDLELANESLHLTNSTLEARVAERTADLQEMLEQLRSSQETIRALSAPILPVAPGVLAAPVVGALDSERAVVLMNNVLQAVAREGARYLIIDVTGIPVIDTHVARVLLQTAQAVKLLGAQVLLTGIRSEVAQTLVSMGVDLGGVITSNTLQSGIAEVLSRPSHLAEAPAYLLRQAS